MNTGLVLFGSVFLASFLYADCAVVPEFTIDERIEGGLNASIGQFPSSTFILGLKNAGLPNFCMGIIVTPNRILTETSCLEGIRGMRILLGATSTNDIAEKSVTLLFHQLGSIVKVIPHDTLNVAMIELPHDVPITPIIQVASLNTEPGAPDIPIVTAGFGHVGMVSDTKLTYGTGTITPCATPEDNILCYNLADGVGPCDTGDFGGGVFDNENKLMGITIAGGCGADGTENQAVDVSALVDWIETA